MIQHSAKKFTTNSCVLGEGILWDYNVDRLLYVDIEMRTLFRQDIQTLRLESWIFDERIGWVQLTTSNGIYILGLQSGILLFNTNTQEKLWFYRGFPASSAYRLNDSFVDAYGTIWFGSMRVSGSRYGGEFASFNIKDGLRIHDDGYGVTNGPLVLNRSNRMLHNDSQKGVVYQFDICQQSNSLTNKRSWRVFEEQEGSPDGMVSDDEGNVWLAMWGASQVLKLSNDGRILKRYGIPAKNVTNVCFGGRGLDRLFVTTALEATNPNIRKDDGQGCIFEIVGHNSKGIASNMFEYRK
jgi:sugar lactone lactonase YvrE